MLKSVKPCINCGADKVEDFKEYNGMLGYEAIICRKCGFIYDQSGIHEPDTDPMSVMHIPDIDSAALARTKKIRDMGPVFLEAIQDSLFVLNQVRNTKVGGKFKDTYALCSHLEKIIQKTKEE